MPIIGITASSIAASGAGDFESIATATGTGSSGVITFSSIPSTYKHLQLRIISRDDRSATGNGIVLTFNGDTAANYASHELNGAGLSVSVSSSASQNNIFIGYEYSANAAANLYGVTIIDIHDYASTSKNKTTRTVSGRNNNSGAGDISLLSGLWLSTSAISSLSISTQISSNFTTASTFCAIWN